MTDQINAAAAGAGNTDQTEELICPHCGGYAERLPAGVAEATAEQSHASCWLPGEGAPPALHPARVEANLCGFRIQTTAGLHIQILEQLDEEPADWPPATLGGNQIVLSFLRYAAQHLCATDELLHLLAGQLSSISARPGYAPRGDKPSTARLEFTFRGSGARSRVLSHHRAELHALLDDLLADEHSIFTACWIDSDPRYWDGFIPLRVNAIEIREHGITKTLTWPGLEVTRD